MAKTANKTTVVLSIDDVRDEAAKNLNETALGKLQLLPFWLSVIAIIESSEATDLMYYVRE
jgi:hypothetical protein